MKKIFLIPSTWAANFILGLILLSSTFNIASAQYKPSDFTTELNKSFSESGKLILKKYNSNAYRLKPSKAGHMGLRMYRHYGDRKYEFLLLQGILNTNKALDKLVTIGFDSLSITQYVERKNAKFSEKTKKKRLRKATLKKYPRYTYMATKVLRHIARLDELGLRHEKHQEFIMLLQSYDFQKVFTDPEMIKAWGAQLANQVYWLKQIDLGDYTKDFKEAVKLTYPDSQDALLSKQQFENKLYTLTHIIIAASGYYQHNIDYSEYPEIIDYFRSNVPTILKRAKEDVIIEVGISLLLVDENYPEIVQIRSFINEKIDSKKRMILSENGKASFAQGEHRNIIAVLLLDWQGCSNRPNRNDVERLDVFFPVSLTFK